MVAAYVIILIILIIIGIIIKSEAPYYYVVIIIWVAVMAVLIPVTLHRTLYAILPDQHIKGKVISKNITERPTSEGSASDLYLTFEIPDETPITFGVGTKVYNSVELYEEGTLVYRKHKEKCFFVRFKREL